jgi:hypothetical protein
MITVAAHTEGSEIASFSNWNPTIVDLAAPGCNLHAIAPNGAAVTVSGTSFAAPLVSLAAGLIASAGITRPAEIKRRIVTTVAYDPHLEDRVGSKGRLDIVKAVAVKRDIVEAGVAGGGAQLRFGDIERTKGQVWSLCGRPVRPADVIRIVPQRWASPTPMLLLSRHFDGVGRFIGVHEERCPLPDDVSFRFKEVGGTAFETIAIRDVTDLVLRLP